MKRTPVLLRGLILVALLVFGCAGSTDLSSVWRDPDFEPSSLRKLMVIGVENNPASRRIFEDRFAAALQAEGIDAKQSYPYVGEGGVDSARACAAMHEEECDGVFVTRLVDQKTVKTVYPPTTSYVGGPSPFYRDWYGYFTRGYTYVTTPGYTVENQVVYFETNLYRLSDGKLVWSALSREWLGQSGTPADEIDPFVGQLVDALVESTIVTKGEK